MAKCMLHHRGRGVWLSVCCTIGEECMAKCMLHHRGGVHGEECVF